MSRVHVTSEVGRLRRVLVHEPGIEVDRMVPVMMEELLFDDILFGDTAREEHRRLRRVLQLLGVEVVEAASVLNEALQATDARQRLLDIVLQVVGRGARRRLDDVEPGTLASILVHGVRTDPRQPAIEVDELFEMPPIPNWCFQRDPQTVIGDRVMISSMAAPARWREALLSSVMFRYHPELSQTPIVLDLLDPEQGLRLPLGPARPSFEGGDVLVLSRDVVAVGHSQRTNRTGVRRIAEALASTPDGPRWLVIVRLPRRRAYMHLDTVLTPIDRQHCLAYPPIVTPDGSEAARVFEIDLLSSEREAVPCDSLLDTLARHGVELEPIPCGGDDPMTQQREQWTDGANAFAVAPGVIILYDRNVKTAEALADAGYRIVDADDALLGKEEVDADAGERLCILLSSHEMSRARGGPHCLTHPLERDDP